MKERIEIDARQAIMTLDDVADGYDKVGSEAEKAAEAVSQSFGSRAKNAINSIHSALGSSGLGQGMSKLGGAIQNTFGKTAIGSFVKLGRQARIARQHVKELGDEIQGIINGEMQQENPMFPNQQGSAGYARVYRRARQQYADLFQAQDAMQGDYENAIQGREKIITDFFAKGSKAAAIFGKSFRDAGRMIGTATGHITTKIKDVFSQSLTLEGATKRITKAINGFTSIASRMLQRMAIKAVFSQAGQSIQTLAGECEDFNTALSSMIGGLQRFNNQLIAAFEPLINAITPIITAITDQMSSVMERVAEFNAVLTGQGHYEQATRPAYDYAAAVGAAADNTEKNAKATTAAAKAQADFNAQIYGFETLHKLSSTGSGFTSSDTASDLSSTADKTEKAFNKMNAAAANNKWADVLRRDFKGQNWRKLGRDLADFAKEGLGKLQAAVKWDNVGGKITAITDAITGTARSLISSKDAWAEAGTAIGDGINTISYTLRGLDEGLSFRDLGDSLSVLFNNALAQTDWIALGQNIGAFFMISWETFSGFIRGINTETLGSSIKDLLSGFFDRFDAGDIGSSIGTFATKTAEVIQNAFGDGEIWEKIGDEITSGLSGFFETFDAAKVVEAINTMLNGIITVVGNVLKDEELRSKLTADIGEMIKGLDYGALFTIISPFLILNLVKHLTPILGASIGKALIGSLAGKAAAGGAAAAGGGAMAALGSAASAAAPVIGGAGVAISGITTIGDVVYARKANAAGNTELADAYTNRAVTKVGGMGAGAAAGALIGSVVPGLGTGIGALVGAGIGGLIANHMTTDDVEAITGKGGLYTTPAAPETASIQDQVAAGMKQALREQGQNGGDIVLRVGYEDIARASLKGQRIINNRQNAYMSFV